MKVFVTGGAGYIGSHTLVELLQNGHEICVCDNYRNSSPIALDRVRKLSKANFVQINLDIRNKIKLTEALIAFKPDVVIHFAGLKAVGESHIHPLEYYENNVSGTLSLLSAMDEAECARIVFSSSATVYGEPVYLPYDEDHPLMPTNPYGRTKLMVEEIIKDWSQTNPTKSAVLLRYFNPVGAHPSGQIGEDPSGIPNNLMPFVAQVAVGRRPHLSIFGDDYNTVDGTGERDYIHVVDLAHAHLAAVDFVIDNPGCNAFNIGTGVSYSVLQIIAAFEEASGRQIPYKISERRNGDIAVSVASAAKAHALLDWKSELSLPEICKSIWNWQSKNPFGYKRVEFKD